MTHYISVANSKGGVAKTTTCLRLAYLLSRKEYKVLIIDLDFQMNASLSLGVIDNESLLTAYKKESSSLERFVLSTRHPNLDILPASTDIINFPREAEIDWLRQKVRLLSHYDFIFFDTSPSLSTLTVMSFLAADHLLVPTTTHAYSLEGVHTLLSVISSLRAQHGDNVSKLLGVLLTIVDRRKGGVPEAISNLRLLLGKQVFDAEVPYSKSLGEKLTSIVDSPRSKVGQAYKKVAEELTARLLINGQN